MTKNKEMNDIKWYQTPLQKELLIAKIRANNTLKNIFKKRKDITKQIEEEIQHRMNGLIAGWSTIFITGTTGTGKSSLALTIAKKFDPTFNHKRVGFKYEEFRNKITNSKPREFYQLDEQIFTHGIGTNRIIQDINNLLETLRKRQNSMIIVSPERKYFEENLFTYTLETIDTSLTANCEYNKRNHEPRTCKCYEEKKSNIKEFYIRSAVRVQGEYLGFYITKIDWNNKIWNEYQEEKDKFMEEVRRNDLHNQDYKKIAQEIMKDPEFNSYCKNRKSLRLFVEQKKPQITISENDLIVEQIRVLINQQGAKP